MSLPELCINRPVMTTLLMLSFVVFGMFGYSKLPVSALPRVDFPVISVSASLPGANPDTMATSVAAPLERAFSNIPGVNLMTSRSSLGSTSITLQFDLGRNIDGAALDVQTQISAAQKNLPQELPSPPTFRKLNPADSPILILALSSNVLPLSKIQDYAEQIFAQQISQLPGVSQVNTFGSQRFAVRIQVDPDAANARGLTLDDIRNVVSAANSSAPVGSLRGPERVMSLDATGQMNVAEDYTPLLVIWKNGAPVRLSDVARVYNSVENEQTAAWFKKDRAILVAVYRQADANTLDIVDAIKNKLPSYQAQLPPNVSSLIFVDRSLSIRHSVEDVQFTLALSIVLVILVIFLFLKSISATIIPSLALPVSLIGTYAFMYILGYSIDNISLLAITLSVGFVVDDAIVMLENIVRRMEEGMPRLQAALVGSKEIGFTILSITISLVAVFIPVLFMGGVVGRVFREFAVTISCAILVSGFVSLTLTPMLCARILHPTHQENKFLAAWEMVLEKITHAYARSLDWVLQFPRVMLGVTFLTLFLTIVMYQAIPKGFFPTEDTGLITASTETLPEIGFEAMKNAQAKVLDIVLQDPSVLYASSAVGLSGVGGTTNQGNLFIVLKDRKDRPDVTHVINQLRQKTKDIIGISTIYQPVQNLNFTGGRTARALYQFTLQSNDLPLLYGSAEKLFAKMQTLPQLQDVATDLQIKNPQINVDVDRDKASVFGITLAAVKQALYNAYGSTQISTIYTPAASYQVILEANKQTQDDLAALKRLTVRAQTDSAGDAGAGLVPLDQIAQLQREVGPQTVNRQSQQASVTLSFNTTPNASIGEAVAAIQTAVQELHLPQTLATNFSGTAAIFQDAQKGQVALVLAAVLAIYIVLGILYESFIHPITILSGLPSAGIGALLILELFGMDLTVIALIGILLLVGLVKKNAIMMVDFALERRREKHMEALEAIKEAAVVRFRPITMTTLAALLGALPIAFGAGEGAELRQPLGVAIVGGLCFSQLLTLYITPVIYYYLDRVDQYIWQKK